MTEEKTFPDRKRLYKEEAVEKTPWFYPRLDPDLFPKMRKGAASITMKDIREGKLCGACHHGKVTFNVSDNCIRRYKK